VHLGPSLGVTRLASGLDPDAAALFAAMSPAPDATRQAAYVALIQGLKADGVWSLLDALYMRAAHSQQAALLNVRQRLYDSAGVNTPTFTTDRGFSFSGTAHIGTGFNPFTATSPQWQQNSASLYAYINETSGDISSTIAVIGVNTLAGNVTFLRPRNTDAIEARINSGTTATFGTVLTRLGGSMVARTGATASQGYRNGVAVGSASAAASGAVANLELLEARLDTAYLTTAQIAATAYGGGMTAAQALALHTRIHTFLTAVGGA
jgi:hypothetical protein